MTTTDPTSAVERPGAGDRASAIRLVGYSFIILFLELALIRYVSGYVRVFGFYLNFVLLATFLGMGVGLLRGDQVRRLQWLAIPALLLLVGAVKIFSNVFVVVPADPNEAVWGASFEVAATVRTLGILPTIGILFGLCTIVFIPLGALLGAEFRKFEPLRAYSLDIAGSLLGILAFAIASAARTTPLGWFAFALVVWCALSLDRRRFAGALAITGVIVVLIVRWTAGPQPEYWSPYYRINVARLDNRFALYVNGTLHQAIVNLDPAEQAPAVQDVRRAYLRPFAPLSGLDTVLVVGAGTGNDVALLLEMGAAYIDAVEIDPVILDIGRVAHFQEPYADPRVHTYIDDARAFLRNTTQRYDVIVFGTLDSQTLLSANSSLRLDNYVFTEESFLAARDRLKPGGSVFTYHLSPYPYVAAKLFQIMENAFGEPPVVHYQPEYRMFNYTFVTGVDDEPDIAASVAAGVREPVATPRDDWPYLYLRHRTIPGHYLRALAVVIGTALVLVTWGAAGRLRHGFDGLMFFLGVGFLLIETKSVTEMSLLFGSTWTVNLLVFSSILVVILLANLWALRMPVLPVRRIFAALFGVLAIGFLVPVRDLLWFGDVGQWIFGGLMVALPVLFAALIFATVFRTRDDATRALGYNLLGAVVGGVLEYSSMIIGVKALYLVAAVAYGAAFLWILAPRGRSAPATVG